WLVVLTAVLMVSSVLISWTAIHHRVHEYYAWLLALSSAMMGVFAAFDLILFYVFFELTLVPLFFLIGIWGGPQRQYAARKFFIFTLAGSLITLLGVLGIALAYYLHNGMDNHWLTFSIPDLVQLINERLSLDRAQAPGEWEFWRPVQFWVFLAMMVGFAVKVPLVPLHTWLPLAHVEAPTAGSVLLAGVLLKIGTYGFLRLCLPLAPDAAFAVGVPLIGTLAVIGIVYGAFCALAQSDIKKLVATSTGRPGLNGFVGEVLVLMGISDSEMSRRQWPTLAVVGSTGIVLGAWYLLTLLQRVFFGPVKEPEVRHHGEHELQGDLKPREW